MKSWSLLSAFLLSSAISFAHANGAYINPSNDAIIPMQKVESIWPAITGVQMLIQWKIYLLLLNPAESYLFPNSLNTNIWNTQKKVMIVLQKMIFSGNLPPWSTAEIKSYWTTSAVDIWEWKVWFLTASHVLESQITPNDVCITNRIIGDYIPTKGFPILNIPSKDINGNMSYTQFPIYSKWNFLMAQIPSVLRYRNMWQWIEWRFDMLVWWASGAPVIIENPEKKWDYGIISIFPWWVSNEKGTINIAKMPRNEVLQSVKNSALQEDKKWWYYSVCK